MKALLDRLGFPVPLTIIFAVAVILGLGIPLILSTPSTPPSPSAPDQPVSIVTDQPIRPSEQADSVTAHDAEEDDIKEWGGEEAEAFTEEEIADLIAQDIRSMENGNSTGTPAPGPRAFGSSPPPSTSLGDGSSFSPPLIPDGSSGGGSSGSGGGDCYGENAAACRAGFVAPTVEYAGYHSCSKRADGNVEIRGLARLVGGSYREWAWQAGEHNGMAIVSSIVSGPPYTLMWGASATFYSMDSRFQGVIDVVGGSGYELIDESQLDSSCRF